MEWLFRRAWSRDGHSRDHDPRLLAFARGAAIGALAGAAVAGSGMRRRFRRTRLENESGGDRPRTARR